MEPSPPARAPILVPFRCVFCASEQAADLMVVSRVGVATCGACKRKLSRADVSKAIERERRPMGSVATERPRARLWA